MGNVSLDTNAIILVRGFFSILLELLVDGGIIGPLLSRDGGGGNSKLSILMGESSSCGNLSDATSRTRFVEVLGG